MTLRLQLELTDEQLDAIAARAAALVTPADGEGFIGVAAAAEFLSCPTSRIYALVNTKRIPHHRDGSRLLFDRQELRDYVRAGGARRP